MSDYLDYTESDGYSNVYNRLLKTMEYVCYIQNDYKHEYRLLNRRHNIRGPASVKYYPNGKKMWEYYKINDKFHNINGPALIMYYENGDKRSENYYIDDKLHNTNRAAFIGYYKNCKKLYEIYYIDGKCHNSNGPVQIEYYEDGKKCMRLIISMTWFKNEIGIYIKPFIYT